MRKIYKALAIMTAIVTTFSACGKIPTMQAFQMQASMLPIPILMRQGEFPVCKNKITLKIGIPKDPLVTDYDTNLYTQAIKEKMNCDIEFSYLPSSSDEAKQKVELMISAGGADLPDVIINVPLSDSAISRYASKGFIVPLNNYYKNSSYYIKKVMEEEPNLEKMITMVDGNIYVVPKYLKIMQNELGYRMWIYEPWLKNSDLKHPKPQTIFITF